MPIYRFDTQEVLPVVELVGGVLGSTPPHLAVAACLMLGYAMTNGRAVPQEKIGKFVEDFSSLMELWDMEANA